MNYNPKCECGHSHNNHEELKSVNYSAGRCLIIDCDCRRFIIEHENKRPEVKIKIKRQNEN